MKLHKSKQGKELVSVLALCDKELLGKVFREGEVVLDLDRFRGFYEGEKVSAKEAESALLKATHANLVGERSVSLAKKLKLAGDSQVLFIGGIPHVQIYKL